METHGKAKYKWLKQFLELPTRSSQWQNIDHSFFQTVEKGHGRIEIRRYITSV